MIVDGEPTAEKENTKEAPVVAVVPSTGETNKSKGKRKASIGASLAASAVARAEAAEEVELPVEIAKKVQCNKDRMEAAVTDLVQLERYVLYRLSLTSQLLCRLLLLLLHLLKCFYSNEGTFISHCNRIVFFHNYSSTFPLLNRAVTLSSCFHSCADVNDSNLDFDMTMAQLVQCCRDIAPVDTNATSAVAVVVTAPTPVKSSSSSSSSSTPSADASTGGAVSASAMDVTDEAVAADSTTAIATTIAAPSVITLEASVNALVAMSVQGSKATLSGTLQNNTPT